MHRYYNVLGAADSGICVFWGAFLHPSHSERSRQSNRLHFSVRRNAQMLGLFRQPGECLDDMKGYSEDVA